MAIYSEFSNEKMVVFHGYLSQNQRVDTVSILNTRG